MSSVDDRIVSMKFENRQFESAASTTMNTMDKLKGSLNVDAQSKGLAALSTEASRFNLNGLSDAASGVSKSFLAMASVGITAIANLTNRAIDAGLRIVKSLTVAPIGDGWDDYNTKLTSVQTIMSATGKTIEEVNKDFTELDIYADKTIYNLTDMTNSLAKFVNAGVDTKKAVPAIKGIANMVALAGQGAGAAQIAMYNLSQSIAGGFLTTTDYRSLNLANVATKEWKDQMIAGAIAAGTLRKSGKDMYAVMDEGQEKFFTGSQLFTEQLSTGWASTEVLLNVLGDYGDTTTEIGNKAQAAAQDVKSLPMLFDTLKAAVGTTWTSTFEIIIGDLNESKELFTGLANSIGGFLGRMGDARNDLLQNWKDLGGRTALIEAFKNAFAALSAILKPIQEAFRDIFPPATGALLFSLTKRLQNFTEGLKIGAETAENIKRTFRGVFAALDIGWKIVKGLFGVFTSLFGVIFQGSGKILGFTGNVGDMLVNLNDALEKGEGLENFFKGLGDVLAVPVELIKALGEAFLGLFNGWDAGDADLLSEGFGRMGARLQQVASLGERLGGIWEHIANAFRRVKDFLQPAIDAFAGLGDAFVDASGEWNFDAIFDLLNTALLGGIVLLLKKFFASGFKIDFGEGLLTSLGGTFDALTGHLTAMQTQVKAKTLLMIAGAIAILTASVVVLSMIDSAALTRALVGLSGIFAQLMVAMSLLGKISTSSGIIKAPAIAAALILLSTAVLILSFAVKTLSKLSWEELMKGLGGVAALLTMIVGVAYGLNAAGGPMIRAGLAMIPLAIGLKILASAVKDFATMDVGDMAKGLIGMAAALGIVALAVTLIPASIVLIGPALVALGIGISAIAGAVILFSTMDYGSMLRGLVGLGGALLIIAGAIALMPPTLILQAAGLVVLSVALAGIAAAMKVMGTMSWEEVARGLVALGGSLAIIAAGLYLMSGTLLGSAALLVAAGALAVLAPVLVVLSSLSWGDLLKGLAALAGVFLVLGVAGLVLAPLVPALLGLGLALTLVGVGLALAGVGALAFATAFSIFVAAAGAGIAIVGGLISLIPALVTALAKGVVRFLAEIANSGTVLVDSFKKLISALLEGIITMAPKAGKAIEVIILTILKTIRKTFPEILKTGFRLLMELLRGIENNIGKIVRVVSRIIKKFIEALGKELPGLLRAGAQFLIDFINGLAKTIDEKSAAIGEAFGNLGGAIVEGIINGITAGTTTLISRMQNLASTAWNAFADAIGFGSPAKEFMPFGWSIDAGIAEGIKKNDDLVSTSLQDLSTNAIGTVSDTMARIGDELSSNVDMNPTITPVLDLSNITKNAAKINSMMSTTPLVATVSYGQASDISSSVTTTADRTAQTTVSEPKEVKFEQNNYSPKALSPIEIYRQTKNQLSMAKEALSV